MATHVTARGNVVVRELQNARMGTTEGVVLYDGPHGTLWVQADRVGDSPEDALRVSMKRLHRAVAETKKRLREFEAARAAVANVLNPSRPNKIVLSRKK